MRLRDVLMMYIVKRISFYILAPGDTALSTPLVTGCGCEGPGRFQAAPGSVMALLCIISSSETQGVDRDFRTVPNGPRWMKS